MKTGNIYKWGEAGLEPLTFQDCKYKTKATNARLPREAAHVSLQAPLRDARPCLVIPPGFPSSLSLTRSKIKIPAQSRSQPAKRGRFPTAALGHFPANQHREAHGC